MPDSFIWIVSAVAFIVCGCSLLNLGSVVNRTRNAILEADLAIVNQRRRVTLRRQATTFRSTGWILVAAGLVGIASTPWVL